MSGISVDPVARQRIQPQRYARNGKVVAAQFQQAICESLNQCAFYMTREYFRSSGDCTAPVTSKTWRFASHIGPVAKSIIVRVLMAPADQATQTHNPRIQITLHNQSGSLITSGTAFSGFNYGNTANEVPSEWAVATIGLNVQRYRDTSFRATLVASESARPISCTVYETAYAPDRVDDLGNTPDAWFLPQAFSVGQPILDEDRSRPQDLAHKIYHRGGAQLLNFSSETDATAPSYTASFLGNHVNIIDGFGSENTTAGRPHHTLDLSYMNRKTTSVVPVRFEAYASHTAGAGGNLRVVDRAGTVYANWTVSGAAAWQTPVDAELPPGRRDYRIEVLGSGGPVVTYAVSAYRYS